MVLKRWVGPVLIAVSACLMAAATWMAWPDPLIDFGRELYVPWRITEGELPYRDVAYFNGPLSPFLNALWFTLFGVSLRTLVLANLAILAVTLPILYRLLLSMADRFAATAACLLVVGLFGFGQYNRVGNFNWICPYSHEMTHGVALSLLSLYLLSRFFRGGRHWPLAASGIAAGLVLLTKAEISLAVMAAVPAGLLLHQRCRRLSWMTALRPLALWLGMALAPPLLALLLMSCAMPLDQAWRGVLGAWVYLFDRSHHVADPFIRDGMGLDAPMQRAGDALAAAGLHVIVLAAAAVLALAGRRFARRPVEVGVFSVVVFIIIVVALRLLYPHARYGDVGRPLMVFMLAMMVVSMIEYVRQRRNSHADHRAVLWFTLALFSALLLLRMGLNVRLYHYGFALTLPAAVTWLAWLSDDIPRRLTRYGAATMLFLAVVLAFGVTIVAARIDVTLGWMATKTQYIGRGGDRFRADTIGEFFNHAADIIETETTTDQTLAVFPEGVMLNYLTRRRTSLPYLNFIPHEVRLWGEDNILAALDAQPPDCIAITHRDTTEYGYRFFGRDYAWNLWAWMVQHYRGRAQVGEPPLVDENFGILILLPKAPRDRPSPLQ